jgi:hypothetical protein
MLMGLNDIKDWNSSRQIVLDMKKNLAANKAGRITTGRKHLYSAWHEMEYAHISQLDEAVYLYIAC